MITLETFSPYISKVVHRKILMELVLRGVPQGHKVSLTWHDPTCRTGRTFGRTVFIRGRIIFYR